MDIFKQFFTLGLGAAVITKEQIEKTVDTLVKKGEVNANRIKRACEPMDRKRRTS